MLIAISDRKGHALSLNASSPIITVQSSSSTRTLLGDHSLVVFALALATTTLLSGIIPLSKMDRDAAFALVNNPIPDDDVKKRAHNEMMDLVNKMSDIRAGMIQTSSVLRGFDAAQYTDGDGRRIELGSKWARLAAVRLWIMGGTVIANCCV